MHTILTDIQNRLTEKVPALRYVDEDWGQLEYEQPPVQFPCALIDIDGFDYSQAGSLEQLGQGAVYVRIADLRLSNTSAQAPEYQKQQAAVLFKVMDDVRKALHGFSGGNYTKLIRTSFKRVRRKDTLREYIFTFTTSYQEKNEQQKVKFAGKPQINIETL